MQIIDVVPKVSARFCDFFVIGGQRFVIFESKVLILSNLVKVFIHFGRFDCAV
jgi:hypothetical protein